MDASRARKINHKYTGEAWDLTEKGLYALVYIIRGQPR